MKRAIAMGARSVRANVVPMVVLWCAAGMLAFGYYFSPLVAAALDPLGRWQTEHEMLGAFAGRVLFCGLLPGLFLVGMQSLRPRRPLATVVAQALWCGGWGIYYVYFYRWMSDWFGYGPEIAVLLKKTALDLFVWTTFVMGPLNTVFFFWVGHDLSFRKCRAEWPKEFFGELLLPNLLANWCIWIPVMMTVYALPLPLQIHFGGLAGCFWALVMLYMNARGGRSRGNRA